MKKAGIIILTYNRSDVFKQCIRSLAETPNETPFELYVLDNHSDVAEYDKILETFRSCKEHFSIDGRLVRSEVNHGFPKGNNMGLKYFLGKTDITHICILNSDVIVTPNWLDRMLADDYDVAGPVTNACGNEQTIPVNFKADPKDTDFTELNRYAEKRHLLYKENHVTTNFLGFFCFIAKSNVIKQIGLLDEQFGLGTFEDDDFCARIHDAGIEMTILRDVFVYHHGTASFSQIKPKILQKNLFKNKAIFETKHNKKWDDREFLPLLSFQQDISFLLQKAGNKDTLSEFNFYYRNSVSGFQTIFNHYKSTHPDHFFNTGGKLFRVYTGLHNIRTGLTRGVEFLRMLLTRKSILFLTRYPDAAESKDGYFQRVLSIDSLFQQFVRIYLHCDQHRFSILPKIRKIDTGLYDISFSDYNPVHKLIIQSLRILSGRIYCHSVLRLDRLFFRKLFRNSGISVFDVHGAVPEEFEYCYNDLKNRDLYSTFESFAVHSASKVITISKSMQRHLAAKHNISDQSCFILYPVLNETEHTLRVNKSFSKESIVYSGGLQKWQQLDSMLSYVHSMSGNGKVTFLVHHPEEVDKRYRELFNAGFPGAVFSVDPEEADQWYPEFSFGLILREDHVLNQVACPTKIIEYLQNDIVPIVNSINIGDFSELNLATVSMHEALPEEEQWKKMVANNRRVLETIYQAYLDGRKELCNSLK